MRQDAFDRLERISEEFATAEEIFDEKLQDANLIGSRRRGVEYGRSQLQKTYLLRLLAEFEAILFHIGPTLRVPVTFTSTDGLKNKLDRIGANMSVDLIFRNEVDDKIRVHRNDLFHGKSPVPRISFDSSHILMKSFLRYCW